MVSGVGASVGVETDENFEAGADGAVGDSVNYRFFDDLSLVVGGDLEL